MSNMTVPVVLPAATVGEAPATPAVARDARTPTVDEKGDAIFRFALKPAGATADLPLDEFYREQLYDLLKVVRLYSGTTPVLVDGFAFRREPERIQHLQSRKAADQHER